MTTEDTILLKILESQLKIKQAFLEKERPNYKLYHQFEYSILKAEIEEIQRQIAELREKKEYELYMERRDTPTLTFKDWLNTVYNPPTLKEKP